MANRILVSLGDGAVDVAWSDKVEPFMQKVMDAMDWNGEEISVLLCGDAFIQELNRNYRNIDAPTDVLSFESDGVYEDDDGTEWQTMGDIALSVETLPKNAEYFNVPENEELKRLLIHGLLHLHGMDHGEEHVEAGVEPTCEMLKIQADLMKRFSDDVLI